MNIGRKKKIVLLGMMSKMPVAGVVWQYVHYLIGFARLGYDVYYVESHAMMPTIFMEHKEDDPNAKAATFIASVMKRCDMEGHWAFHAIHDDGGCYGLTEHQLKELYASADLIINVHGGTMPLPEHTATGRLVYLETDPVAAQIELHNKVQLTIDFLDAHCAYFTFAENYGKPDCKLPVSDRYQFIPTRQPVICDLWDPHHNGNGSGAAFTTIGNWRQQWREVHFQGEVFHWSKHFEFLKFLDLPNRTPQPFELALSSYEESDKNMLEEKGWRVRRSMDFSMDADAYRKYIRESRGEFTVAKDQNVRLRTGWFSDRSATYLAAGRPVITQDTAFGNTLPTGEGLYEFLETEQVLSALERINSDYKHSSRAAANIAKEFFSHDVVLPRLLSAVGL
jgi:hypothetical protein